MWRGSGEEYPVDDANRMGYYERKDVVRLNYDALRLNGLAWTSFPSSPLQLFNLTKPADHARFLARANPIVSDMAASAPFFVLKDVRFSRTLPLWRPLLARRGSLVCVIPYRHPAEVERSSRMPVDRIRLWRNYMLAALASARDACVDRTVLVEYTSWLQPTTAAAQLRTLRKLLRCAGAAIGNARGTEDVLRNLVRPAERHHRADSATTSTNTRPSTAITAETRCLFDELRSGRALRWSWDARTRSLEDVCHAVRAHPS